MERERWRQVEQIFHAALQVEESRRSEFVRQSCAKDEHLRREVESLLAHHHEDGSFIEKPAFAAAGASSPRRDSSRSLKRTAGLAETLISHYRILGKIGSGGMGVVYEAEDLKLGRHVALKFIPENLAGDPKSLERFTREARAASLLNHPNICTIHGIEDNNGHPFIVMEHLEGESLKQAIAGRAMLVDRVLEVGTQVAEALVASHAKNIVHRDIKPANILITPSGQVKDLDFGLAKLVHNLGEDDGGDQSLTAVGVIPGTAVYMSPEQARSETIDARSDLFSFGTVLYEMSTGKKPFSGNNSLLT